MLTTLFRQSSPKPLPVMPWLQRPRRNSSVFARTLPVIALLTGIVAAGTGSRPPMPIALDVKETARPIASSYQTRSISGFTVLVSRALLEQDPAMAARVLLHIEADLDEIAHVVPAAALAVLREAPIWVELQGTMATAHAGRGMCCHWSPSWLRANGLHPEKAGGVEIINPEDFLNWRRDQPYMLFHEMAHALHQRLPGLDPVINAGFEAAADLGLYESVRRNTKPEGEFVRAYAVTNSHEYFAELSEAYFALNDFYPYTRAQLRAHDPGGAAIVERIWTMTPEQFASLRGPRE